MSNPADLATVALLQGLAPSELEELAKAARFQQFEPDSVVLDRQSDCRGVYLVVDGAVDVVNFSAQGREIAYARLRAGDFFGELSAIDGEPRSANVVAHSACRIAVIPREVFHDLLRHRPDVAFRVLQKMARIIRTADERIMDLATLGAQSRVCIELLRLAKPDPVGDSGDLIYPLPTQAEIAALASTTRETVARVIGQLIEAGLVRKVNKTIYIDDRDRLAAVAQRLDPRRTEQETC